MTVLLLLAITIGIRHAFEPDHIAAVLTISTQSKSLSATAKQGAIWGVGHTITLLIFSMILIVWQIKIDEGVFALLELFVGVILILMGIDVIKNIKKTNKKNYFIKTSQHDSALTLKAFGIGLLHGAVGSGVIIALVTTTIDSLYLKFTYITLFSVGLITCMAVLSILVSGPLHRHLNIFPLRYLKIAAGSIAILIGMKILFQSGIQINTLLI